MPLKRFLAGFLLIGVLNHVSAQSNECEQTLNQATEEFNAGHFYGIPALLRTCIERNNFSSEQQVRAYLLLCQAYLIIDDPLAAEDSYLKLLKADPEYIATNEKDPIDVVYLSKKFTATPIFTPHFGLGTNVSIYRTIYDINTQSVPDKVSHVIRPGLQFGAGLDWNINDNASISVEGVFSSRSFKTIRKFVAQDDRTTSIERQFGIDIPIYFKYGASTGQIRPYGYVGGALNLLLSSKGQLEYNNVSPSTTPPTQANSPGPTVSFGYNRTFLNRSLVIGGGVRYKIGKDFVYADLRYMAGLSNMSKARAYYPDGDQSPAGLITNDALSRYRYVDGYFRLDNLAINVGYVRPLYNPRKIKTRGVNKVSREMRKKDSNETK